MGLRICKKCGIPKDIEKFPVGKRNVGGRIPLCRECRNKDGKKQAKERRILQPEKLREATRRWRRDNPEKSKASDRKSRTKRTDKIREEMRRWKKAHPEKERQYREKRRSTSKGKLNWNTANAIRASLRLGKHGWHWEDLVGYTLKQLKKHLEKQFVDGMSWENYGKKGWEIDHRIPQSAFNFETPFDLDFRQCWALRNLQPLWVAKNRSKKDKLERPHQPSLLI